MKTTLFFLTAFLGATFLIYGQNNNQIDYTGELVKSIEIPKSPEAAAFEKYGNVAVSMYTGSPNISIPIYSIKGREMSLPISLTYDASGVKVDQQASQVGLGWNLNVGGRISRVVNGMPDSYITGDYASIFKDKVMTATDVKNNILNYAISNNQFSSITQATDYLEFLQNINTNHIDAEPDYYSLSVLGISDYIVFDLQTMLPITLNNPRIKVVRSLINGSIVKWTVTNEDGTKFYFDQYESTRTFGNDIAAIGGIVKEYASSWVLTKIESPNKKDVYEFTYTNFGYWQQPFSIASLSVTNKLNPNSPVTEYPAPTSQTSFSPEYNIKQLFLTEIKHNGRVAVSFELGNRYDVDINSALNSITIYDFDYALLDPVGHTLKKYQFQYSYFGIPPTTNPATKQAHEIRLKLDKIDVFGSDLTNYKSYEFDYFSPQSVPDRWSFDRDYLGYYNGAGNSVLYPDITISAGHFAGANRNPNITYAVMGNLKKITYPTGGSTEFEYELHKASTPPVTSSVDVTYANRILAGGTGNSSDCGSCCIDKFQTPPKVLYHSFQITDAGNYTISFTKTGNANAEAYILNRPDASIITYNNATNPVYCIADNALWQNSNGQTPIEVSRFFAAGYYQITLVNKTPNTTASLRVHRLESQTTNVDETLAGLRVKKVTDYTENNNIATSKTYQYTTSLNGSSSSGEKIYDPKLYTYTEFLVYENDSPVLTAVLNRSASASGGNQPHVAYNKVYEVQAGNGYIEHNFNTGQQGLIPKGAPPYSNSYRSNYSIGKEKETNTYSQGNTLLVNDKKEYYQAQLNSNVGFGVSNDPYRSYQYAYLSLSNGIYTLGYVDAAFSSWDSSAPAPNLPVNFCNGQGITCINNISYARLKPFATVASGKAGNILKNETNQYFSNGTSNQVVDYIYDAAIDHQLRETVTTDSNGATIRTKLYYPKDNNVTGASQLTAANRLNEVVKSETYKGNILLATKKTDYIAVNADIIVPNVISTRKGSNSIEDRIHFLYDTNGNLKESYQTEGVHTAYIWGYNNTLPIAKVENATYVQIASQVVNIQNKSDADNDRTIGTTGNEGALRLALTNLRNSVPNGLVSTYTYDPLIGVTSITDPSGNTSYFYYDTANRLQFVKNKDGEVLEDYQYNYKVEEIIATTTSSATTVTSGQAVTLTTTASGGTGNFTYKWTVSNANLNQVFNTSTGSLTVTTTANHAPNFTVTCEVKDTQTQEVMTTTTQVNVTSSFPALVVGDITYTSGTTYVGKNITHTISLTGGSGSYKYSWSKINSQTILNIGTTTTSSTTNSRSATITSQDCSYYTVRCTVKDLTTNEIVVKTKRIFIASGCSSGGGGGIK